ncbi:MAG TPA: hypothetical protein VHM64_23665 [Candidatus Binatia bacterium]|nr:hypothetical protein [Candidatus Binatia bacterium]
MLDSFSDFHVEGAVNALATRKLFPATAGAVQITAATSATIVGNQFAPRTDPQADQLALIIPGATTQAGAPRRS